MRETEPEVDYFRHLMPLTPLHLPRTQEQDRDRFFFNIQHGQHLSTSLARKINMEAGSFRLSTLSLPLLSHMQEQDRCVSFECCQYLSTSLARKVETDVGCFNTNTRANDKLPSALRCGTSYKMMYLCVYFIDEPTAPVDGL